MTKILKYAIRGFGINLTLLIISKKETVLYDETVFLRLIHTYMLMIRKADSLFEIAILYR